MTQPDNHHRADRRSTPIAALLSPKEPGWSESFIKLHAKSLFGGRVHHYTGGHPPSDRVDGLPLAGPTTLASRWTSLRTQARAMLRGCLLDNRELRLACSLRQLRVALIYAEYGPTGVESMRVARLLGIPLVVNFHGYDAFKSDVLKKYMNGYRELFDRAAAIIVVSQAMADQLVSLGALPDKVIVIPAPPAESYFSVNAKHDRPMFVFAGRFVDKKGPQLTIAAFHEAHRRHPEARLVMAGDGPLLEPCRRLAEQLRLSDCISFPGVLDERGLHDLYRHATAYVQHSVQAENGDSEGTPISILEASAAGLPVISTFHAGIPQAVLDEATGLLNKEGDVSGMAAAMSRLVDDPGLTARLGHNGREHIGKNYAIAVHVERLNTLLEEVLNA